MIVFLSFLSCCFNCFLVCIYSVCVPVVYYLCHDEDSCIASCQNVWLIKLMFKTSIGEMLHEIWV